MKISELNGIITSLNMDNEDMDVSLFNEETEMLEDFTVELREEAFDGFDTVTPASIVIKRKKQGY